MSVCFPVHIVKCSKREGSGNDYWVSQWQGLGTSLDSKKHILSSGKIQQEVYRRGQPAPQAGIQKIQVPVLSLTLSCLVPRDTVYFLSLSLSYLFVCLFICKMEVFYQSLSEVTPIPVVYSTTNKQELQIFRVFKKSAINHTHGRSPLLPGTESRFDKEIFTWT